MAQMLYPPMNPEYAAKRPSAMLTKAGVWVDPLDPDPALITLAAVAAGIDTEIRWRNQTTRQISVSEHSIRHARISIALGGTLAQALAGLLHDTGEFLLCDMPGPVKQFAFFMTNGEAFPYSVIENCIRTAVVTKLIPEVGLRATVLAELAEPDGFVHRVDKMCESIEALRWLPGSEGWALRRDIPSQAWMVADVPQGCTWRDWFDAVAVEISRPSHERMYTMLRESVGLGWDPL